MIVWVDLPVLCYFLLMLLLMLLLMALQSDVDRLDSIYAQA